MINFVFIVNDTCTINWNATTPGFSSSDIATMQTNFYANLNIGGKGGVLASPDTDNGPGGCKNLSSLLS